MVDVHDASVSEQEPDPLSEQRRAFADDFATMWSATGAPIMDGRVLGYLMIMRREYISSADLAAALEASAGAVSMSTRRLVDSGFAKRRIIPGDRNHYFYSDEDVWGTWLAGERRYLDRQRDNIEQGMGVVADSDDPGDRMAYRRMRNGRDYMRWLRDYHYKMLEAWEAYKAERDESDE
ncbi:MAG: transcriptional regulator [Microbacterium sp.]|uniref:GbsR/MarR family transcriptional regulator n=1 Tax=Micrococcales TaxID=85006 RepID=UPI00092591FE|nr:MULTISPECIES: MarR family transcriptional regulator [Micrococcales]MBN9154669.1 transcriptional regulator [Microbacterium sp.]MBN9171762.1 transcriptional regulator [Microbacterium sp.]MBN9174817.1 transcriptional regulator [Microbacterium sp.]MBN9180772.1 transcriptional regulator [Microbacterium sp.]MBN9183203.1 transcriptional regulator [Microbacterium sp.]